MEFRPKAFDVETAFAMAKKRQTKKFRGPESPLYIAVCPVVCIMRFLGMAPYDFSEDRLVPSKFYLIFSFGFCLFYSYLIYVVYHRFTHLTGDTELLRGTEYVKIIFNYITVMFDLITTMWNRQKFTHIWNSIQDYDDAVRILGYSQKERKTRIVCWLLIFFNTILFIAINQSGMYAFDESWVNNMAYMCGYIGSCVAMYKFVGITFLLGQRFRRLNDMAQECVPSKNRCSRAVKIDVRTIQSLHNELMIVGDKLNSLYMFSLLFWLANLTIHSVSNLYFIIGRFFNIWEKIQWRAILCLLLWLLAFLTQLFAIHIACDFTSTQANCMGGILVQWQVYFLKQNLPSMIMESTLHMLCRRLDFSAGGCFNVNLPLIRSIAALLTTYLVILLQLQ